jgi:hypothetical protein
MLEFLSQASFIVPSRILPSSLWQPAGVTVLAALPPWERIVQALPNCTVFVLSVTWYRRAASPRKVCSFSQTMSKTDATPEKQNRQVAFEKSHKSVTTGWNWAELCLSIPVSTLPATRIGCNLPNSQLNPCCAMLHAHSRTKKIRKTEKLERGSSADR